MEMTRWDRPEGLVLDDTLDDTGRGERRADGEDREVVEEAVKAEKCAKEGHLSFFSLTIPPEAIPHLLDCHWYR